MVYTDYRPVPLQHFIFPSGGDGIHLVVDEFGKFREDNFSEAIGKLAGGEGGGQKSFKKAGQKDGSDCYNIQICLVVTHAHATCGRMLA